MLDEGVDGIGSFTFTRGGWCISRLDSGLEAFLTGVGTCVHFVVVVVVGKEERKRVSPNAHTLLTPVPLFPQSMQHQNAQP